MNLRRACTLDLTAAKGQPEVAIVGVGLRLAVTVRAVRGPTRTVH